MKHWLKKYQDGGDPEYTSLPQRSEMVPQPGITNDLLKRQVFKESRFVPGAVSRTAVKPYYGLAQVGEGVMQDYERDHKGEQVPDPYTPAGARKLQKYSMDHLYNAEFIDKKGVGQPDSVRIAKALASYNRGQGNILKHLTKKKKAGVNIYKDNTWMEGLPEETTQYVNSILGSEPKFEEEYTQAISDPDNAKLLEAYNQGTDYEYSNKDVFDKEVSDRKRQLTQEVIRPIRNTLGFQDGAVIKDNNGYWNPDNHGKVVEIGSNEITMKGVNQPLIGVSDTGDTKLMKPGEDYKFQGTKVTEYPVKDAKPTGTWLDKYK